MPTPFYHLAVAQAVVAHPNLSDAARALLRAEQGAFLFGNTAPDVQTVSGQTREATHFFNVPNAAPTPAWVALFDFHPALQQVHKLPPAHAAFMAGYLSHLLLDQLWIIHILVPVFFRDETWPPTVNRQLWHNVLRTYLDFEYLPRLVGETGEDLAGCSPDGWLPFVADSSLVAWRDFLAEQLTPGHSVRTIEVLAERLGVPPAEFEQALRSPEAMQTHLFTRFPLSAHQSYREHGLNLTIQTVNAYLTGDLGQANIRIA